MREMKNEFQALRLRQQLPELKYGAGGRAPRKGPLAVLLPSFLDAQEWPGKDSGNRDVVFSVATEVAGVEGPA